MSSTYVTRVRTGARRSFSSILDEMVGDESTADHVPPSTFATGFQPLDTVLSGGLRAHDLTLVGGAPGVGKTIAALQWARHMAVSGHHVMYLSYEHEDAVMAGRLLALEMGLEAGAADAAKLEQVAGRVYTAVREGYGLAQLAQSEPLLMAAIYRVETFADRLHLVQASGAHTGLPELTELIIGEDVRPSVVIVDYLQKVAVKPEPPAEEEKVLRITEGLKDMALELDVSVMAIAAADATGLRTQRLRLHHLRGSTALAYECDTAIMLNGKFEIVAKAHRAYDAVRAQQFHNQVVFSVEKNRGGPNLVDLEFGKHFHNFRFDPLGSYVTERLVDEGLDEA